MFGNILIGIGFFGLIVAVVFELYSRIKNLPTWGVSQDVAFRSLIIIIVGEVIKNLK